MMVYEKCGNQRETSRDVEGWSLCEQYVAWRKEKNVRQIFKKSWIYYECLTRLSDTCKTIGGDNQQAGQVQVLMPPEKLT